jgi:hypothetical protein
MEKATNKTGQTGIPGKTNLKSQIENRITNGNSFSSTSRKHKHKT